MAKIDLPVRIVFADEMGKETCDIQILTAQILTKWIKNNNYKDKDPVSLEQVRVCLLSEEDLYLNFMSKYRIF